MQGASIMPDDEPQAPKPEDFITLHEASQRYDVPEWQIQYWRRIGKLGPKYKLGRNVVVPWQEVAKLARQQKTIQPEEDKQ